MASSRAAIVSQGLTARLEAVPFHKSNAARVFPQPVEAVPFYDFSTARVFLHPLLPRGVVPFAGAHLKILLESGDLDGTIAAIGLEVSRMIGDHVLAAQLIINGRK